MEKLAHYNGERFYFDANIFIYAIEGFTGYETLLETLLQKVQDKAIRAITSELTLAEVLVKPMQLRANNVIELYETMLSYDSPIETIPVSRARAIWRHSAELRTELKMALPDAVHVATALYAGCSFFLTEDKNLRLPGSLRKMMLEELR